MDSIAIVTGAARGIGAAICKKLSSDGWSVIGLDLAWPESTVSYLQSQFEVDVTDNLAITSIIASIAKSFGPIGALINNAGITRDAMSHKMDPATQWAPVLDVNLSGPFYLCRAVLPIMREHKFGRIVNISSMNALRGQYGQANYVAAKAGLIAMTKSIALENATLGITANCIAPGFIETAMTKAMKQEILAAETAKIPVGRMGTLDDIAHAAAFLASPLSGFITGEVLSVNGGQLMA